MKRIFYCLIIMLSLLMTFGCSRELPTEELQEGSAWVETPQNETDVLSLPDFTSLSLNETDVKSQSPEESITTDEQTPVEPSAHIHSYENIETSPTCTEKGYTTYTCNCGHSYVGNRKNALGHSFGPWTVTKIATESAEGEQIRSCTRCSFKETAAIEKVKPVGCAGRGIDIYEVQRLALEYVGTLENAVADPTLVGVDRGGYAGWTLRIFTSPYDTQEKLLNRVKEGLLVEYTNYIQFQSVVKLNVWIDVDSKVPGEYCIYILHQ